MAAIDDILSRLPDTFEGTLFENGIQTTTRIHYSAELGFKVEGLLEELPPSLSLRWGTRLQPMPNGLPHSDSESAIEFNFFKMLDPRIVFNRGLNEGLEVTSFENNRFRGGRIFVGSYNVRDLEVPDHMAKWFEKFRESRRSVALVTDGGDLIRAMSQIDIPPSPSIVSIFFSYPNEHIDWGLMTLLTNISISEIQPQRIRSGAAEPDS